MKASSAVHYLYVHTEDSAVEALLFAVKTVDRCRLCILSQNAAKSPTRRHWFDEGVYMSVLHFNYANRNTPLKSCSNRIIDVHANIVCKHSHVFVKTQQWLSVMANKNTHMIVLPFET